MGNNSSASTNGRQRSDTDQAKVSNSRGLVTEKVAEKSDRDNRADIKKGDTKIESRGEKEETALRHVTFWRDGFQFGGTGSEEIDNRVNKYDDPENREILTEINQGTIRPQLLGVKPGQAVELIVTKKIDTYSPGALRELDFESQQPQTDRHENLQVTGRPEPPMHTTQQGDSPDSNAPPGQS